MIGLIFCIAILGWNLSDIRGDIRVSKIKDTTGLLPTRIGTVQNVNEYWKFVNIYHLTPLVTEAGKLERNYELWMEMVNKGPHDKNYKTEMDNYHKILENNIGTMKRQLKQIMPTFGQRTKRGALNVVGSVIKAITGNLDNEDAKRYDKIIEEIISTQGKTKTAMSKQVTLVIDAISSFNRSIENLQSNQILLQSRILQMGAAMKEARYYSLKQEQQIIINAIFSQLIFLTNAVNAVIGTIINAVTFVKLETFHPSIMQPEELIRELASVSYLKGSKLPVEATIENTQYIENVLKIKAYMKKDSIIFIIMIPLVEPITYTYYHLFPLPLIVNNTHLKSIIPLHPYLAMHEHRFISSHTKCSEIIPEEYLCYSEDSSDVTKSAPCEVQLLLYTDNYEKCVQRMERIDGVRLTRITRSKWTTVAPLPTKIKKTCGKSQEMEMIQGTYLVELTSDCTFDIDGKILQVHETQGEELKRPTIPQLTLNASTKTMEEQHEDLKKMQDTHVRNITKIRYQLQELREEITKISEPKLHQTPLSIWTLIIYMFFCLIGLSLLCKYGRRYYKKRFRLREEDELTSSRNHPLSL